ncbi:hypothetical protein [Flavobacterium sp. FlaQc-47]|uniref:hypothetical protein n=1 Tax=Flavobacterium sp. FlaQc-47 TaxID=3374180 RepID=UPI00375731B2
MKEEIALQIQKLGGNIDKLKGKSLQEDLQSIEFKHPLYPNDFGDELFGVDEFYSNNLQLYSTDKETFYNTLLDHFFSDHEIPYGQSFYRKFLFTPFKKDSADFDELDGLVEEHEIRETVIAGDLEFICICYSYGFPDQYFVCLTDPIPENPTVYGTDHEVFFQEINNEGTLEEFFKRFLTKDEFLKIVEHYIENVKTDK